MYFLGRRSSLAQLTEILKDWSIRDKAIFGRGKEKLIQGNDNNFHPKMFVPLMICKFI